MTRDRGVAVTARALPFSPVPGPTPTPTPTPSVLRLAVLVLVSLIAGAMNSIAGGGTLITFPALVWFGIPPIMANATSTVALCPASISSVLGYRRELAGARPWAIGFAIPSMLGGVVGAWLLVRTPPSRFEAIVPYLVLGATALFVIQRPLTAALARWTGERGESAGSVSGADAASEDAVLTGRRPPIWVLAFQFVVSIYGGYFGAGMGIIMLATLGLMGLTNIHRMNGLKNWGGFCANIIAAGLFAFSSLVRWPTAIAMAMGAAAGGYAGSQIAQRVGPAFVRGCIIAVGVGSGVWMLVR